MPFEEKTAWAYGVVALAAYLTYLVLLVTTGADYVAPMLWTIGASIVANIIATIAIGTVTPRGKDQRDRDIYKFGEYVGNSFVVVGAVSALILAIIAAPHFWIANVLYLCFVLSAVLGTIAKLVAYRRGLPQW